MADAVRHDYGEWYEAERTKPHRRHERDEEVLSSGGAGLRRS
jgi:hypothetical protein